MNERDIFLAALEHVSSEERSAYLDKACVGDIQLRGRIERLLKADSSAGRFLEVAAPAGEVTRLVDFDSTHDSAELTVGWKTDSAPKPVVPQTAVVSMGSDGTLKAFSPDVHFGPYEILETIGRGGMGVVVKALDSKLRRVVAIKMLAPQFAAHPQARQRFLREAQAAASVRHDNVVIIYTVDENQEMPFLVMECIAGQSLQQKLDARGPLTVPEVTRIGMQIAAGLSAAHQQSLVHRDIKPANILLEHKIERVKITDFGLARAISDVGLTETGQVAGTPQFMSPEQAQGRNVDARSDLFSLGSVMYSMCTARAAFRAESAVAVLRQVCDDDPPPIRSVNPDIPAWLVEIISKLMAKEPKDRFQTAAEVVEILGRHLTRSDTELPVSEITPPSRTETKTSVPTPPTSSFPRHAATGSLLATAAFLLAAVFVISTGDGEYELTTDDPQIDVMLGESGGIVVEDRLTKNTYTLRHGSNRLKSGQYELTVTTPFGLELDTPKFRITRWGKTTATVIARAGVPTSITTTNINNSQKTVDAPSTPGQEDNRRQSLSPTELLASTDWEWSPPENLGPPINIAGYQAGPHLSSDGLTLLFHSWRDRAERKGPLQLWQAQRKTIDEPFNGPVRVDDAINGEFVAVDPSTTADGLVLVFGSERPDSVGLADLWMSTRSRTDSQWGTAINLGEDVNSSNDDWEPEISQDGLTLFFHSNRGGGYGGTDLWMSRRGAREQPFGPSTNLGAGVNGPDNEGGAALSSDGLTLVFHRVVEETFSLWRAVRPALDRPFDTAQPLVPEGLFGEGAAYLKLAHEGRELYFAKPGPGGIELWVSHRVPKQQASANDRSRRARQDGFTPLFSGKDLARWSRQEGDGTWQVVEGVLTGRVKTGECGKLNYSAGEYANFHLRAEVRLNNEGNSGVDFWWRNEGKEQGYQVEIQGQRHGSLARHVPFQWLLEASNEWVTAGDWFLLEMIANGAEVTTKVNGHTVASLTDSSHRRGALALELDGRFGPTVVEFRKLEIKELDSPSTPAAQDAAPLPEDLRQHPLLSSAWEWSEPVNLGRQIYPEGPIHEPFVSSDELTLLFRDRATIWMATRTSPNEPFGRATKLIDDELMIFPTLSPDGLLLTFCSQRAGGMGRMDLWKRQRTAISEPFGETMSLGREINSTVNDGQACFSADGLTLLFCSTRAGGLGDDDFWRCTRRSVNDEFGPPQHLGSTINCPLQDFSPALCADDRILLFASAREGDPWRFDLWLSVRPTKDAPFGPPRNLGSHVNTPHSEGRPRLSAKGQTLYFDSNREGGHRQSDLWSIRRVPKPANAPFTAVDARMHQEAWSLSLGTPTELENSIGMKLRLIPAGKFRMGFADDEPNAPAEEKPQHTVTLTKPFYLGTTEITMNQFAEFATATDYKTVVEEDGKFARDAKQNPLPGVNWRTRTGDEQHDSLPVTCIAWRDAQKFCEWLSNREQGRLYRLPTDAEWEFACRAGTTTAYSWGADFDPQQIVRGQRTPAGSHPANAFGLHDMHGNIWEWCLDARRVYHSDAVTDPLIQADVAAPRIVRGGGFRANAIRLRSAARTADPPDHASPVKGFRVLLETSFAR